MNRIRIYPYSMQSKSAKELARGVEGLRVKYDGVYLPREGDIVINWGNNNMPNFDHVARSLMVQGLVKYLNRPDIVQEATNKIISYRKFEEFGVPTIEWTQNRDVAIQWSLEGHRVVARNMARASGGKGITLVVPSQFPTTAHASRNMPMVKFYTKYTPHSGEYRVHVVNGKVIDFVKKKKMSEEKMNENGYKYDKHIRNHDNGWVFARQDVELPDAIAKVAIDAVKALGLDFGAADVIHSKRRGIFCLEVNTAPGLEGTTLEKYVEVFKAMKGGE